MVPVTVAVAVAMAMACAEPIASHGDEHGSTDARSSTSTTTDPGPSSTAGDGTSTGTPAPPEIVDIGFDVLRLRPDDPVVLTAVVHDPDGDVVTVELFGPDDLEPFGALLPHPSDRWQIELRWPDVHERWPLTFEQRLDLPLVVRARDAAGHEAEAMTSITVICEGLVDTACDGVCVDVQVDPAHCNGCGQACVVRELEGLGSSGGCQGGACLPRWSECFAPGPGVTCTERCAAEGARCIPEGCGVGPLMRYGRAGVCEQEVAGLVQGAGCDDELGADAGAAALRCCCG